MMANNCTIPVPASRSPLPAIAKPNNAPDALLHLSPIVRYNLSYSIGLHNNKFIPNRLVQKITYNLLTTLNVFLWGGENK